MCGHVLLAVPWRLAVVGHGCFSLVRSRHRIPSLRPPCPRRLSQRSTRLHSHRSWRSTHCHILAVFSQHSPSCDLTVSARLDLSSVLTTPAVKKLGCSPSSRSSVCDLTDCVNLHWRVQDGRCHAGWHPHEQIRHVYVPFLSEH